MIKFIIAILLVTILWIAISQSVLKKETNESILYYRFHKLVRGYKEVYVMVFSNQYFKYNISLEGYGLYGGRVMGTLGFEETDLLKDLRDRVLELSCLYYYRITRNPHLAKFEIPYGLAPKTISSMSSRDREGVITEEGEITDCVLNDIRKKIIPNIKDILSLVVKRSNQDIYYKTNIVEAENHLIISVFSTDEKYHKDLFNYNRSKQSHETPITSFQYWLFNKLNKLDPNNEIIIKFD